MAEDKTLRIYGLVSDSIVDGPNLRFSVFVQGCAHGCKGCHNPESHDPNGGYTKDIGEIFDEIEANKLVHDVTFSGGEPFDQAAACAVLAEKLKSKGYGIWAFTGYLYEDLLRASQNDRGIADFLNQIDVLVDGPFVEDLSSYELDWKGSSNQRLIDLHKTRESGNIKLWEPERIEYRIPSNW